MPATLLATHRVEKPWGRHRLWPGFADPPADGAPVGEIWFQTHDEQAHAAGLPRGKDECWVILDAEPDSTIALGTREPIDRERLRRAARDGSIEALLDWKPVRADDFFYSASGTIHAIGAGITLVEVQQNSETTYRLYDYGRPRELHLDAGIAVAEPVPFVPHPMPGRVAENRTILVEGPKFVLERWEGGHRTFGLPEGTTGWLVPLKGEGVVDGVAFRAGDCLTVEGEAELDAAMGSDLLFAYPGATRIARMAVR